MLEWYENEESQYEFFADVGPFTLNVHTVGQWWIEDAVGAELCKGYAPEGFERAQYEVEVEFRHRLRMAAETLDSSWLEAEQEEEEEEEEEEPVDPVVVRDAMQKHVQEHATLFNVDGPRTLWVSPKTYRDLADSTDDHQKHVDMHSEFVSRILLESTAHNEFVLLNGREPDEEEMKRAIEWAKTPAEPAPEECSGCGECDEDDCYSDERPLSPELADAIERLSKIKPAQQPSGYNQILAAIKAESKDVKL